MVVVINVNKIKLTPRKYDWQSSMFNQQETVCSEDDANNEKINRTNCNICQIKYCFVSQWVSHATGDTHM